MDEFNTLECSHLSPHHHCHFHQYQHLPPPPPLYQVGARSVQTASCPKHGQKQLADQEAPLEKIIKPISKVSAKTKQMDTKEILKILRERAICIVSCFLGLLSAWETILLPGQGSSGQSLQLSLCISGPSVQNSLPLHLHPTEHRLLANLQ